MKQKLKTETDTPAMGRRVEKAFRNWLRRSMPRKLASGAYNSRVLLVSDTSSFFEHAQWWVEYKITGAQYSVCDAVGGDAVDGFTFEMVTRGDEAE